MKRIKTFRKQFFLITLLSFCALVSVVAQKTITGTITDEDGAALPGATITVKGTTTGTITDLDGKYRIDVPSGDVTLVFSSVGLLSENIYVGDQTEINISMVQDIVGLEQVIVVGYGTMKKSDISGSIVSVGEEEITEVKTFSALESLQGKMAGVDITMDGGRTGTNADVLIRGKRALNASNDPLVIVDGVPYGTSLDLNPNDIASIEVLKDASSTAIYGSRGANGVILVTTKKGSAGQSKVFFNTYYGITQPYQQIPVFDRESYIEAKIEAYKNEDGEEAPLDNVFQGNEAIGYELGTETNWQDICTQNGIREDYHLGIIGGNEKTSYSTSLSYSHETGITLADEFKRYTFKLNLETEVKPWLRVGGDALLLYRQRDGRGVRFTDAILSSPIVAVYDSLGNYIFEANDPNPRRNPLAFTDDSELKTGQRLMSNLFGMINFTPDLYFRSNVGVILDYDREGFTYPQKSAETEQTESGISLDNTWEYTWTNILNYNKTFGKHSLNLMLGNEMHHERTEYYSMWGEYQPSARTLWWNMGSVDQASNQANSGLIEKSLVSFFGRVNYNLADLIIFNFTGRYDGASQLKGDKWDFFPSTSVALRLKSLSFIQPIEMISDWKIRAGYGVSGNAAVNAYATDARLNQFALHYQFGEPGAETNVDGYRPEFLASEDLRWEVTKQYNIATDIALFKNRVYANIDYFYSRTEDVLLPARLPISTGFFTVMTNAGEVETKGFEIQLQTVNIHSGDFTWETNLTYSAVRETILALTSGATSDIANGWFVGEPVDVIYDYNKIGIWQLADSALAASFGYVPGDIRVQDIDNNDTINAGDRMVVGNERPKWTASMVNTFRFKGFDLTVNMYARIGHMIDADAYSFDPRMYNNMLAHDYWTVENPTNEAPRLSATQAEVDFEETLRYRDGSYIKMKNLTLGYSFPVSLTQKINIAKLRIYGTMNNPLILYSKLADGIDPEREGSISWPMSRSFIFGLNVEF
ncbi:MAG: TonB-dependent receptor [Bacteroidales bacterium]|nr:TonB-dependent receptor [Bacteroidales bacterium]